MDYAFGKASGSVHNVERSTQNMTQLSKIGIHDNAIGRQIVKKHLLSAFNTNKSLILNSGERIKINTLLAGPGGFKGVESVWEGLKLITFTFFGG